MIFLDTSVLIEIFDKNSERREEIIERLKGEEVAIPSISFEEFIYGILKFGKRIPEELLLIEVIPFTREDSVLSARIEIEMEKIGKKIPRMDAMIAAITINNNAKLFTFDEHFKEIATIFPLKLVKI